MNPAWKRRIRKSIFTLALLYLACGIFLYCIQDLLLFHPRTLPKDHEFVFNLPFEECNFQVDGRNLSVVKFKSPSTRRGLVLFFHGNMENVEHYRQYPAFFTRNGYETWMMDYPGFGKSTGKRSEATICKDALFLYQQSKEELSADSILIYGKSIGTGVAAFLASKQDCKKLVLETPYYSIDALAKHYFPIYPVMPMTRYAFPVYDYLKNVKAPITIFHGTQDEVIPFSQAKRLQQENNKIELITIDGGRHNNLAGFTRYQTKLDSLLRN